VVDRPLTLNCASQGHLDLWQVTLGAVIFLSRGWQEHWMLVVLKPGQMIGVKLLNASLDITTHLLSHKHGFTKST
jgi:hypothetical protein